MVIDIDQGVSLVFLAVTIQGCSKHHAQNLEILKDSKVFDKS